MKKVIILLVALVGMISAMAQWVPLNSGTANNLRSVHFVDADNGFAVGDSGTILKTIDGGATWNNPVSGTSEQLNSVFFADATTCYTVGWSNDTTSTILKSSDGGFSWHNSSTGAEFSFESVYFTDADTGYAAGGGGVWGSTGRLFKTTNGGESWSIIFSIGFKCFKVSLSSPDTGFVVSWGEGFGDVWYQISKTSDAGLTWNTFSLGGMNEIVSDVCFTNFNTGYGVGPSGKIIKTTNGGSSWTSLSSGTSENLNSICFTDSVTGYVVGNNIILKTIDGGINWTSQSMATSGELLSVYFPSFEAGYIVSVGGIILKTINGGGLGFNENGISSKFLKVFPNPATDKITVSSSAITGNSQLSIFNVSGEKVMERQLTNTETQLDIGALPRGVYFVRVQDEKRVEVEKIIKQ